MKILSFMLALVLNAAAANAVTYAQINDVRDAEEASQLQSQGVGVVDQKVHDQALAVVQEFCRIQDVTQDCAIKVKDISCAKGFQSSSNENGQIFVRRCVVELEKAGVQK